VKEHLDDSRLGASERVSFSPFPVSSLTWAARSANKVRTCSPVVCFGLSVPRSCATAFTSCKRAARDGLSSNRGRREGGQLVVKVGGSCSISAESMSFVCERVSEAMLLRSFSSSATIGAVSVISAGSIDNLARFNDAESMDA